jgi:survival of motor neuron protein-interacting protein 1
LDGETCALRALLCRYAAIILGSKTEMDDEVVMLNILMTISGRYFGQGENSNLADRSIRR